MAKHDVQRTIYISPAMRDRLVQITNAQAGRVSQNDLIREAIRRYLDEQEDLIGSRRHFQKLFQTRIDQLENTLTFHLNLLTFLIADNPGQLQDAIIAARRDGETLLAQIQAVRELEMPHE